MPTVAHLTRKIIERKPFLEEALSEGIINNAALAEKIIPELEKELKKKIKFSAANLAIRRMAENLQTHPVVNLKFNKDTDISLKSNIIEIVLYKNENIPDYIKKIYNLMDFKKGDFLTITQGVNEVMIITNQKHKQNILGIIPNKFIKKKIDSLSALTVNIPESAVEGIGLFYVISKELNWENINIIDIVSTYTEITLIVEEDDASRAFDVLKKLINRD
jgi:aspartokinase